MDNVKILSEIKEFLSGRNNDLRYLVNVETDSNSNVAECIIHEPNCEPKIVEIQYESFMYMKDLEKNNIKLYNGYPESYIESKKIKYGVTITKLKTGNQKRLINGYCYKITSHKSYNNIINYLKDGGIDPYEKKYDDDGNLVRNIKGEFIYQNRDYFYSPKTTEQFFISTKCRLYKGCEEYKNVHRVTFDIETTGLRYQISRVFAIGIRDNRGFEKILEVEKFNDDESEIKLIKNFFLVVNYLKPAIISGYNSEMFDFEFILGRAKILNIDLATLPTTLKKDVQLKRRTNVSVKYGNTAEKYTATEIWGISVNDILHAAKKTAAVNTDLKSSGLKYVSKFEKIAKPNRTYIDGEDNAIGRYYQENKIFLIDDKNNYVQIPDEYQELAKKLYKLQANKTRISEEQYSELKKSYLKGNKEFISWFKKDALHKNLITFISGKKLVKQYLLDDLWETEQVDELYNQTSFMLAKIVPTTYQRICTMGTAAIWNLVLTAWSYENDLAIPHTDENEKFSGGLARCFKSGYSERIKKIDYASLYPMIQLSEDVFPIFDITGVMRKLLIYLTTTRNIYKKLANGDDLNNEELTLLQEIDSEVYYKLTNNSITLEDKALFKIKQLPIKILNNSMFGALGSGISFNWSDNTCAARITCTGRLHLRHAVDWFTQYGCIALLAVTDGINFSYPEKTKIRVSDSCVIFEDEEKSIDEMWQYGGNTGLNALIIKYNKEEMKPPYMAVDDDGDSVSCLNLSRINYASLVLVKDKITGELKEKVKLTGNTIKSKTMPEYIEDFIDRGLNLILHGKGREFVEYYHDYCDNIYLKQIPLKKIATKAKVKMSLTAYKKRGKDKNGRDKGMQAHMELLIIERENIAWNIFTERFNEIMVDKNKTIDDYDRNSQADTNKIMKLVSDYLPPEPELDSVIYYYNVGTKKSHGDTKKNKNGESEICSKIICNKELLNNPNMTGDYNFEKYLSAFNKRVESLLVGFDLETQKKILVKSKNGELVKEMFTNDQLVLKNFDLDDYDESMTLENMEVDFWNKTGYDPRLIWNGFKMCDNIESRIHYEIYDNALKYLNDLMSKSKKEKIKSINDNLEKNDLVLIKNYDTYLVGKQKDLFIEIIKENVQIPKCEIEIELDRIKKVKEKELNDLKETTKVMEKDKAELDNENEVKLLEEYFIEFKQNFNINMDWTMDYLFSVVEEAKMGFEAFVKMKKQMTAEPENDDFDVD